jgi:glycosyltransferase involved in cell wall biosynthesis
VTPRVAFFTDSFHEVNGVALTSREFVGFAARQGYSFFSVRVGAETAYSRTGAMETFEIANSPAVLGLERDLAFDLLFYRHRNRIWSKLSEFKPDLIHVTGPSHAGMLGAFLAYDLKVPLVASWHTNVHDYAARRLEPALQWLGESRRSAVANFAQKQSLNLTLRFYKLARLVYAPNPELAEMLGARTGRPAHLMARGIDTHLFSPQRRTRRDGDFVIGFVGRLSREKNVRQLVDLERALLTRGIKDCRFVVVGDGSERQWLSQNLQRAEFTGVLSGEALANAYADMDAFVFPSQTDTFGNVVLEAMASGVPVVVSNEGGPKFLVAAGRNGLVAGTPAAFVEALIDLRANPDLRERMSSNARAAAMLHSWDRVFENVYSRYDDALQAARHRMREPQMPLVLAP